MSAATWDSYGTGPRRPPWDTFRDPRGFFTHPGFSCGLVRYHAAARRSRKTERSATAGWPPTRGDRQRQTIRDARLRGRSIRERAACASARLLGFRKGGDVDIS
jgi:hypothetical protein